MGSAITTQDSGRPGVGTGEDEQGLDPSAVEAITAANERVRAACDSPMGLARIDGDDERRVSDAVTLVLTDRQLIFCRIEAEDLDDTADVGSLEYADVAAVDRDDGGNVEIATVDGVTWRVPLGVAEQTAADAVARDLDWLGTVRGRVRSVTNDVELAVGEIDEQVREMDWEAAVDGYETVRDALDRVQDCLLRTEPVPTTALAPDVDETERTLERAAAELSLERAHSQGTLAEQLVDGKHYQQARPVLERARGHIETARTHAAEVTRRGGFQFGEERELEDELEAAEWEIESVASEPLRHGHEARVEAANAEDPERKADQYEQAILAFQHVLTLAIDDGDDDFPGDREAVERHVAEAARDLVPVHRQLARERWNAGVERHEGGDVKAALRLFTAAQEHLARAHELAEQVAPERAEEMAARLEGILESLTTVRETATVSEEEAGEAARNGTETASDEEAEDPAARFSAAELRRIDTATEIHLGHSTDLIGASGPDRVDLDDPSAGTDSEAVDGTEDAEDASEQVEAEGEAGADAEAEVGDVVVSSDGGEEN